MDPYQTLGVSQSADQDEIKKSYRKLAKKYHPDLNPGNKEAEKKFKDVSHAFDLIGTPEARAKFDRGETDEQQQKQYEDFMNNRQRESYYQSQQDGAGRYSYNFGEDINASDFFENLFGSQRRSRDRKGSDIQYKMEVDFREAALGAEKVITLPDGRTLQVNIPAGIEAGKKLKLKGLGEPGIGKGAPGDAYVEISVRPLEGFSRTGNDIVTELPVSFLDALTGAEVNVPTIEGNVLLKVPSGVSTGMKLRIKGKGAGKDPERGNQIVIIKVVMPKEVPLSLKEKAQELKKEFNYNPRLQ